LELNLKKEMRYFLTFVFFLFTTTTLFSNDDFYYSYIPKKVYQNQVFPLTIASEKYKNSEELTIIFDSKDALYNEPLVVNNNNGSFYTFYFKANKSTDITTPSFTIETENGKKFRLNSLKIPIIKLEPQDDFSGVYGSKFKLKNYHISEYNEDNLLVSLSLEAFEANLDDFHLDGIKEQNIEDIHRDFANIDGEYFAIVPKNKKELSFSYYHTLQEKFISTTLLLQIKNDPTTEQLDINPKDSSFDTFKKYLFIFLVLLFIILYIIKRDKFYLFFIIVSAIILVTFYIPKGRICIKKGSDIYILPTNTSTISANTEEKINRMTLDTRGEYIKVEYQEGLIGWVRNDDVCED
jgi:hypothetical protein